MKEKNYNNSCYYTHYQPNLTRQTSTRKEEKTLSSPFFSRVRQHSADRQRAAQCRPKPYKSKWLRHPLDTQIIIEGSVSQ